MTDRERALYYLGGLVAAFVLAFLAGSWLGPTLDLGRYDRPSHEMTR
ncbi:MAG: hypothetical protein U0R80_02345 [Nocardioidaceae bacterium]